MPVIIRTRGENARPSAPRTPAPEASTSGAVDRLTRAILRAPRLSPADIEVARTRSDVLRPWLVDLLGRVGAGGGAGGQAPVHALALLAELRATEALPLVASLVGTPDSALLRAIAPGSSDLLPWAFYRLGAGDPAEVASLVEDAELPPAARASALLALRALARREPEVRARLLDLYDRMLARVGVPDAAGVPRRPGALLRAVVADGFVELRSAVLAAIARVGDDAGMTAAEVEAGLAPGAVPVALALMADGFLESFYRAPPPGPSERRPLYRGTGPAASGAG